MVFVSICKVTKKCIILHAKTKKLMTRTIQILPLISIFFFCSSLFAEENTPLSAVEQFLSTETTKNANISLVAKNLETGEIIASHRANSVLPPASTMKLLTTATALEMLGGDYTFPTYLETDGTISNHVLHGNLYIRGTGDPTLGSQKIGNQMFLYKWVQVIKALGIEKIDGAVIADVSFFDGDALNPSWLWEDIGNYYAPGIFAIAYLDNTMNIQLRSAEIGSVAEVVKTVPYVPEVSFENHIRCTKIQYDGAFVHGVPYSNQRYLVGSVPSNRGVFGVKGDLPNPGLLLARHFIERLREQGVQVSKEESYITEPQVNAEGEKVQRTVLYTHRSEPLREIIKETNVNSNNLYAEQLFRHLGSRISTPATIQNSRDIVISFWKNRKIDLSACGIEDGCGLSPIDAVSAEVLLQILEYMKKSKNFDDFYHSLPVAGETGTLRGFCLNTPLEHRLHAKSGTTSKVKSYAGYVVNGKQETCAFAVIVNNQKGKVKQAQVEIQRFLNKIF